MILDTIMAHKRAELESLQQTVTLAQLKTRGNGRIPPIGFAKAIQAPGVNLIAEVKRASPSKGVFDTYLDPVSLAETYAANGAAAISVVTDRRFFQGSLESLGIIKTAISRHQNPVPLLRKDFVFDPYQVHEAYAFGADALLLIAAVLSTEQLGELLALTRDLGMDALVEVHDSEELSQVLSLKPAAVGINNRNLQDFRVDLNTFGQLRALIPDNVIVVAESGVRTAADVRLMADMGADAVLVGEALVTATDVAAKVRELTRHATTQVDLLGRGVD